MGMRSSPKATLIVLSREERAAAAVGHAIAAEQQAIRSDRPLRPEPSAVRLRSPLAGLGAHPHAPRMFVVTETDAAAIRAAFKQRGELSAAVEVRRLFPGVTDIEVARECARTIADWKPLPVRPRPISRRHPGTDR
jgi:hypothetical protein